MDRKSQGVKSKRFFFCKIIKLPEEELKEAFKKAKEQGLIVDGKWFEKK